KTAKVFLRDLVRVVHRQDDPGKTQLRINWGYAAKNREVLTIMQLCQPRREWPLHPIGISDFGCPPRPVWVRLPDRNIARDYPASRGCDLVVTDFGSRGIAQEAGVSCG